MPDINDIPDKPYIHDILDIPDISNILIFLYT